MKKLFSAFRTDPWAQPDAERRAIAVRDGQSAELIAALADIAVQDGDPGVRRAALSRLVDVDLLRARAVDEADADTRAAALSRLTRLLVDPDAGLSAEVRMAAINAQPPGDLLERIAAEAPDLAARRVALARIERTGFLQRRCVEESDAGLRAELLQRIDAEDALERLAEKLRRIDKTLSHRARERVQALRLERGDPAAVQRHADALCETLTRWARSLPDDAVDQVDAAERDWNSRRDALDAAAQNKVAAHFVRVRDAIAWHQRPPETPSPEPAKASFVETNVETAVDTPAAPVAAAPDWSAFDQPLAEARRAARDKQLGSARPALHDAREALKALPRPDRARRERLAEAEAEIAELERWQRWSANRVRARLCDDLEALIAAGHHPDGVAHRVRELQQEWARVDATEQTADPAAEAGNHESGLARRFRSLCARAMAPTKPYFEQRHALRVQHREAIEALLGEAGAEALAAGELGNVSALRRRLTEALRNLDQLEPRARTPMAQRLRGALADIDARLQTLREEAALARSRLIARLRRDLMQAAPDEALALAKQAQASWKTLPRPGRDQEAELTRELAALVDPIFQRQRATQAQNAEQAEHIASESRRILDELAALAEGDAAALAHADGRIAALEASWKALYRDEESAVDTDRPGRRGERDRRPQQRRPTRPDTRERERRFDQAVSRVRQAQAALEAQRLTRRLQALVQAAELFAALQIGTVDINAAQAQWTTLALDDADRRRLAARWQQAQTGDAASADNDEAAECLLVDAEMDAGLDSPAAALARRRERQMQRLSARMQGGETPVADPLAQALAWARLGPGNPAAIADRQQRMRRLLAAWSNP